MKFVDFSPPQIPTLDQQQDALHKGLGRAWLWAERGCLDHDVLLDACLRDLRYDRQCEGCRGEWLWGLVTSAGLIDKFESPLLQSLRSLSPGNDQAANQLCELAFHYAKLGRQEFRDVLYSIVATTSLPDNRSIGEKHLLALDGENAFQLMAFIRGRYLETHAADWDDVHVVMEAMKLCGEERIHQIMATFSDPDRLRFAAMYYQEMKAEEEQKDRPRLVNSKVKSVADVMAAARDEPRGYWLINWGRSASDDDLSQIWEVIRTTSEPAVLDNLLRVFRRRALPQFDEWLIELCKHTDADVMKGAYTALAQNSDSRVRKFAIEEITGPDRNIHAVPLLQRNFQAGDEQLLCDFVEVPDDAEERHSLLMDIRNILQENMDSRVEELAQVIYFHTPCAICRGHAIELLEEDGTLPGWMAEEAMHDSYDSYRKRRCEQTKAE